MNEGVYIGVEIGGTKTQVVLGNASAEILERRRFQVIASQGAAGIRDQIASAIKEFCEDVQPQAVGAGFGGPINWRTGQVGCSHQIEGWAGFELGNWLRELTSAPARVDNDANTAALAEAVLGAAGGRNPAFYVTLGSGVGGGLVVDRQIYHGLTPGEAEIGHVRLNKSGVIVEQRCSGWAVNQLVRERAAAHPGSVLAKLASANSGAEARALQPALAQNDPLAGEILASVADDLAFALSHVSHLAHPEVIVIGGGLSLLGEPLAQAVQARLQTYLMDVFSPGPEIKLARLSEDAVPVGALLLARAAKTLV